MSEYKNVHVDVDSYYSLTNGSGFVFQHTNNDRMSGANVHIGLGSTFWYSNFDRVTRSNTLAFWVLVRLKDDLLLINDYC